MVNKIPQHMPALQSHLLRVHLLAFELRLMSLVEERMLVSPTMTMAIDGYLS